MILPQQQSFQALYLVYSDHTFFFFLAMNHPEGKKKKYWKTLANTEHIDDLGIA